MSTALLVTMAALQGIFLVLLLSIVAAGHWIGTYRVRRYGAQSAQAAAVIQDWLGGQLPSEDLRTVLDSLDYHTLASFLLGLSTQRAGEEWGRLASELRATEWFAQLCLRARSRLWWRRLAAARLITDLVTDEHDGLMKVLLEDSRPAVRIAAADVVDHSRSEELVQVVFDMAASSQAVVRGHLLELLSRNRAMLEPIIATRLCRDSDDSALSLTIDLAGAIGVPRLQPAILPHGSSPVPEIRIATARALASYPHPRSSSVLLRLLSDPRWEVRTQAAASLGTIGAVEACEALGTAIRDESWWVRFRAAVALRAIGPEGRRVLEEVDGASEPFASDMAAYVIGLEESVVLDLAIGASTYDSVPTSRAA
jgi:hypothetical protein